MRGRVGDAGAHLRQRVRLQHVQLGVQHGGEARHPLGRGAVAQLRHGHQRLDLSGAREGRGGARDAHSSVNVSVGQPWSYVQCHCDMQIEASCGGNEGVMFTDARAARGPPMARLQHQPATN